VRTYFRNFYARRVLRIFPLYYGCLFFFFLVLPFIYPSYQKYFSSVYHDQAWYWLYASNWRLFFFGLPANPVFFHFWSLAVEEQFYLFWPVLFRYIRGRALKITLAGIITASIVARVLMRVSDQAYYSTLTPCEPLLLGAWLCILEKEDRLKGAFNYFLAFIVLAVAGLSLIFYHDSDLHISNRWLMQYGYTAIDVIWVSLLGMTLSGGRRSKTLVGVISQRWLIWLGKYSYGIYVFHWLILQLFVYKYEGVMIVAGLSQEMAYWLSRVSGIAVILACSYLSYRFYEKRWLRLKVRFET